jgi:hypothetical protein
MKYLFRTFTLFLCCITLQVWGNGHRFIATLTDGHKVSFTLPNNQAPTLPLKLPGASGSDLVSYNWKDISCVELIDASSAIDGCTKWEVKKVATPSVILGIKHTDKQLLGVVRNTNKGTVYRWIVKQTAGSGTSNAHYALYYGVAPQGSEIVYPFIQDNQVWLRDLHFALGRNYPDFVQAVDNYYIKGSHSQAAERQAKLKDNPTTILDLDYSVKTK